MTQPYYQPQQEIITYQDQNITVTNARVIIGPRVFVISQLTSIRVAEITPQRAGPAIFMALGIFILVAGISQYANAGLNSNLAIASGCIIGSLAWFFLQKSRYSLRLGTFGGEVEGYISKDPDYIGVIAGAINQVLTYRH